MTLSGDVHSAWAFEGPCDGDGSPVAVEFVAPCITATPMARQLPPGWRKLLGKVAERLPEARWFELEHHGFLRLTIDVAEARAEWHFVDTEDPEARTRHAATWRHPLDAPGGWRRWRRGRRRPHAAPPAARRPPPGASPRSWPTWGCSGAGRRRWTTIWRLLRRLLGVRDAKSWVLVADASVCQASSERDGGQLSRPPQAGGIPARDSMSHSPGSALPTRHALGAVSAEQIGYSSLWSRTTCSPPVDPRRPTRTPPGRMPL